MLRKLKSGHWPIFLLSSVSSIGNLFLPIILVRILSPEDIGIYKIFFLHLSVIPFLVMAGGPIHSVFYWAGRASEERKKFLNATWILTLLLSSLVLLIGFPLKEQIASHLDLPHKYIFILLFTGFLTCPTGHFTETSIALGKSALGSIFDTLFELIKASGFIFIAWKFRSLETLFLYFATIMGLKLIISSFFNHKYNDISTKTDKEHMTKVFIYCLPISLSGCRGFFVDKIDLLLLSSHLDTTAFAFYSMGCLVVPPLYLLEMSVQKVLIPSLAKNYIEKNFNAAAESFQKAIRDIALLIIPSIFGLIIFATPIVKILYTDQYIESATYLQLFAFSYILLMLPHDSVARATGNTKWVLKVYLLITPIALAGAYMAAKYAGVKGVLIVTILVKFIPKFMGLKLSKNLMNWKWSEMFPVKHLILYVSICTALTIACFSLQGLFDTDVKWFLVCGAGFAVIYLSTVYLLSKKGKYA
jgi:O-antigen/teichoic acid export membrane protein